MYSFRVFVALVLLPQTYTCFDQTCFNPQVWIFPSHYFVLFIERHEIHSVHVVLQKCVLALQSNYSTVLHKKSHLMDI